MDLHDTRSKLHSNRLKERLLHHITDLRAKQQGKEVLLIFVKDIGGAIKCAISNDMDRDAINFDFNGSFTNDCEKDAVPGSLHALVQMILEGRNIEHQSHGNTTKDHIAVILSELLQFKKLPIYLSILIHAKTRKRELIDKLYNLGLCISYDRLMCISADLANTVCNQYNV